MNVALKLVAAWTLVTFVLYTIACVKILNQIYMTPTFVFPTNSYDIARSTIELNHRINNALKRI